jgi:uncharacterized membrane protein
MDTPSFRRLLNYFLRGLLILVPLALTIYIIVVALQWIDGLIPVKVPGLGLLIVASTILLFGYLASSFIAKPIFEMMEEVLLSVPLISLIYSSIKDLLAAFVGDKKKFNQPVLVKMDPAHGIHKMGFITQRDLSTIGLRELVAVYLPHSYNFSGNFYLVPRENVTILHLPGADVMKFIVSGGVSGLPELELACKNRRAPRTEPLEKTNLLREQVRNLEP